MSNKKVKCLVCIHCGKRIRGDGINRFKQHLVGVKGETTPCPKVDEQIRFEMLENLKVESKKRSLKERSRGSDLYGQDLRQHEEEVYMQDTEDIQEIQPPPTTEVSKGKKVLQHHKKGKTIGSFFMPRVTPGGQPSIKSVMQSKEAKEKVDLAVAKWMIDASIPFNASTSAYYQTMFDAACSFGADYKAPNFYDLRGYLLTKMLSKLRILLIAFIQLGKKLDVLLWLMDRLTNRGELSSTF